MSTKTALAALGRKLVVVVGGGRRYNDHARVWWALDGLHTSRDLERERDAERITLREIESRLAEMISQHEPLAGLGIDRDAARKLHKWIVVGRIE